eukprot:gnl/Hemi2/20113_TR6669_c0_g1_i1.p1 gnl/Hemi2/20113_TR6669_c0_g1~~gnl/Hemi2/20113_TR6669_c0_g1_i1.p1  ORF type:complete len:149 (-),score=33.31 gnl/Hemi2/20113_TR6669_c0_g1_i1:114-560(-)
MTDCIHYDYGAGRGGKIWECWKLEPCCGSPCNFKDGCYCLLCWWICGIPSLGKLFAAGMGQEFHWGNHCLSAWFLTPCVYLANRHNLRRKAGIGGKTGCECCGDLLCCFFCGPCVCCQNLRASQIRDWDLMQGTGCKCCHSECKFIRS